MKRRIIVSIIILISMLLLTQAKVTNALLGLILVGSIPGTGTAMPFWLMMAVYCAMISLLVTWYVETLMNERRKTKASAKQRRMPRRRYSHI